MSVPDDELQKTLPLASAQQNASSVGQSSEIVGDRYRVDSVLGQGGMGTVYLATQIFLQEQVALKILDKRQMLNETVRRRFEIEGKAAYALNHPNLVRVLDFGILQDQSPFFAMEYVRGLSLQEVLKDRRSLDIAEALQIFNQVCDGLIHAHRHQVIHRDIKPSNIMLAANSDVKNHELHVKIVDFGIAKIMSEERGEVQALTQTGEIFGSPLYMSPEQCKGGHIDGRTDIYSMGCTLFETLAGTPPHVGTNALRTMMLHTAEAAPSMREASLGKNFPHELERVVARMLAIDPSDRYHNLEQVKKDLLEVAEIIDGNSGARLPSTPTRRFPNAGKTANKQEHRDSSLFKRIGIIVGCALFIGLAGFGLYSLLRPSPRSDKTVSEPNKNKSSSLDQDLGNALKSEQSFEDSDRKALAKAAPILTSVVKVNKQPMLQIKFPTIALGSISYGDTRGPFEKSQISFDAKDTQTVPLNTPLELGVGGAYQASFYVPSIFDKIPDDLFSKVFIRKPSGFQLTDDAKLTQIEFGKGLSEILQKIQKWKKLSTVSIIRLKMDDAAVQSLNDMTHLNELTLSNAFGSENLLLSSPLLMRLKTFNLRACQSDELMEKICDSKALSELTLDNPFRTPRTYIALGKCKTLQRLNLHVHSLSTRELDCIAQIKSLREVYFNDATMEPQQLTNFMKKCPQLTKIYLSNASRRAATDFTSFSKKLQVRQAPESFESN